MPIFHFFEKIQTSVRAMINHRADIVFDPAVLPGKPVIKKALFGSRIAKRNVLR
jgi:hypothetical protein